MSLKEMTKEMIDKWKQEYAYEGKSKQWQYGFDAACKELAELLRRLTEGEEHKKQYFELIMAVGEKTQRETRHETALRYIKNAENHSDLSCGKGVIHEP